MTRHNTESSDALRRRIKFVVALIVCVAIIIASYLEFHTQRIEFELLRLRTKSSFVVVSVNDRKAAFSLDEKQTQDVLNVIGNRTEGTRRRMSVRYRDYVDILCKDNRSACLGKIWVHPSYKTESTDVLEELLRIAEHGVSEAPDSHDGVCEDTSTLVREH